MTYIHLLFFYFPPNSILILYKKIFSIVVLTSCESYDQDVTFIEQPEKPQ